MEQSTPTFRKLISRDLNILYALMLIVIPIISLVFSMILTGDLADAQVLCLGGASVIGAAWLIYRYNTIKTTFRNGMTVKGNVIRIERRTTRKRGKSASSAFYAVVSYSVNNESFEERLRVPRSHEKYGVVKDMTIDLILREEKPKTVFIKRLYLD